MFVFYHVGGPGNHAFCSLMCRPVTAGGNCKGQGDVFFSRHGTFLCFIIADQTDGPKK